MDVTIMRRALQFFCLLIGFLLFQVNIISAGEFDSGYDTGMKLKALLDKMVTEDDKKPETARLLEQWGDYIKKVKRYENFEILQAIHLLNNDYIEAILELEGCCRDLEKIRKNYSSSWLKRFKAKYGEKYLATHRQAIGLSINALGIKAEDDACVEKWETAFIRETILYEALKSYINIFGDFYRQQSEVSQALLHSRKSIADLYLIELQNGPIRALHGPTVLTPVLAVESARNNFPKIYTILKGYPEFSRPFDSTKAIKDLLDSSPF